MKRIVIVGSGNLAEALARAVASSSGAMRATLASIGNR